MSQESKRRAIQLMAANLPNSVDHASLEAFETTAEVNRQATNDEITMPSGWFQRTFRINPARKVAEARHELVDAQRKLTQSATGLVRDYDELNNACCDFQVNQITRAVRMSDAIAWADHQCQLNSWLRHKQLAQVMNDATNASYQLEATERFKEQNMQLGQKRKQLKLADVSHDLNTTIAADKADHQQQERIEHKPAAAMDTELVQTISDGPAERALLNSAYEAEQAGDYDKAEEYKDALATLRAANSTGYKVA